MASSSSSYRFGYHEILMATDNFSESSLIGSGGFGDVYRGVMTYDSSGAHSVAIKRLDPRSNSDTKEFVAEANMLSELRHSNVVSLIGFCADEDEMILVHEYMPNGTLKDHLHKHHTPLSWLRRLKICIGAARGLSYLHGGVDSNFTHGKISSSSILLDQNWESKVLGFGLSKTTCSQKKKNHHHHHHQLLSTDDDDVRTRAIPDFGYVDPVYIQTGRMRKKSDVYSFGVLLFEVLSGKPVLSETLYYGELTTSLVTWARVLIKQRNFNHITDSDILDEISPKGLKIYINIAKRCVDIDLQPRPTMSEVIAHLETALASQEKFSAASRRLKKRWFCSFPSVPAFTIVRARVKKASPSSSTIMAPFLSFKYDEIVMATNNFAESSVIGRTDSRIIYRGKITYDSHVAIHRLDPCSDLGTPEFMEEVNTLHKLRHCNIVSLIGFCVNGKEKILVYEYMPNGTLEDHLHRHHTPLSWKLRLKICIGAARGLSYLHGGVYSNVTHGKISSSSILLDQYWGSKVSGFGLSKTTTSSQKKNHQQLLSTDDDDVRTRPIPNFGYVDPIYFETGRMRKKSDVYAFGVLLLEVLSRKQVSTETLYGEPASLVTWARVFIKQRNLKHITDSEIWDEISPRCLKRFINIAKRCVDIDLQPRPTMPEVVADLETVLASQERFEVPRRGKCWSLVKSLLATFVL